MFEPASMRIHPVFTKAIDWTGDGRADGVEVLTEFSDGFGDTCKASGELTFELFTFAERSPDTRGKRVSDPWVVPIRTADQQRERWSRTARGYSFRLAADKISADQRYVLSATYAPQTGPRLFDRVVLGPRASQ
jgi:hypothetical protein